MSTDVEAGFSAAEVRDLSRVAGTMIPASAEFGAPGADDPAIVADILKSLGRDLPLVREALAAIAEKSGGAFATLGRDDRESLVDAYYKTGGAPAMALGRVILAAYYRDDRVLLSLGHEARAPFPKGHDLEQGDWSLLEAVRHRQPFWRDDRPGRGN